MQDDNVEQGTIVAFVIGSAIVLSLATALGTAIFGMNAASTASAPSAAAPKAAAPAAAPRVAKVYFDTGSTSLPADAAAALQPVIEAARASATVTLAVSGYHDSTGDPARNAELARARATAVHAVIVTAGIVETRVVLRKPLVTAGAADDREARRVEVTVE